MYLLSVGYSSTVMTSREFHAEMVRPLYKHSMPIIMASLVPNHKKKQLIPERTIEPPISKADKKNSYCFYRIILIILLVLHNNDLYSLDSLNH